MTDAPFRNIVLLSMLLCLFPGGCETDPATATGVDDPDETDTTDTETTATPTDNDDDDDDDPVVPDVPDVPVCMTSCETVMDCVAFDATPLEQVANWACQDHVCIHLGCTSDANCREAYPAQNYKCSAEGECLLACSAPADCVRLDLFAGDDDMDENNYLCQGGMCRYQGCLSTAECGVAFGNSFYCTDVYHTGVKACSEKCAGEGLVEECVVDHDDPSYDDDNYQCVVQTCFYTGCNSDEECGDGRVCIKFVK